MRNYVSNNDNDWNLFLMTRNLLTLEIRWYVSYQFIFMVIIMNSLTPVYLSILVFHEHLLAFPRNMKLFLFSSWYLFHLRAIIIFHLFYDSFYWNLIDIFRTIMNCVYDSFFISSKDETSIHNSFTPYQIHPAVDHWSLTSW